MACQSNKKSCNRHEFHQVFHNVTRTMHNVCRTCHISATGNWPSSLPAGRKRYTERSTNERPRMLEAGELLIVNVRVQQMRNEIAPRLKALSRPKHVSRRSQRGANIL